MSQAEEFAISDSVGGLVEYEGGNPGRTPDDELEERVELTYRLLADGLRKSEIKLALKEQYQISARTAENYLARARERQLLELREERESHRASALAFYKRVVSDPNAKISDKLQAQKRIDQLLGLEVPFRVALATVEVRPGDDEPFEALLENATPEQLQVLRGLYESGSGRLAEADEV